MVKYKYGVIARDGLTEVEVELQAFLKEWPVEDGWLGKPEHFWNVINILWGPKSPAHFIRNPWSEKFISEACQQQYLAVLGAANSSKSDTAALWGLVNWLADPMHTMVMVTSTSLKDSRKRVWGRIVHYYSHCPGLPGRLVDSLGIIRTDDKTGVFIDNRGISLIAGEKKKEKEAIGKMIGMKQKRMFMIADELPELSEAILEAAFSNLANNPYFQLIGIGNFNSIYDSLGVLARPKKGYGSVTPEDEEWETERGYCIRFDGLKSPNLLLGEDKWPFLYNKRNLRNHRAVYGENSAALWRMCRSFPCPEGNEQTFYSEADFILGRAHEEVTWLDEPQTVIGADPAFTTGGDRFAVVIGQFGRDKNGLSTLAIKEYRYLHEDMALTQTGEARDIQTVRQLVRIATDNDVAPPYVAVDASGPGGLAFYSIISAVWSSHVYPVKFGEKPSERQVSEDDPKKCCDAYFNRVTELWATGRNFVRAGQIKGLPPEIARELKARQYRTIKSVQLKVQAEPKADMKTRIGFSPDLADAFLILVDLCREQFGFLPGSINGLQLQTNNGSTWIDQCNQAHAVYENTYAEAS